MINPLPGLPLIESPLFLSMADGLGLSDEERRIGQDLLEHGFAVFDFPDSAIEERIERIKHSLGSRYGVDLDDP